MRAPRFSLRRLWRSQSGVSAVEFAFIAPVMVVMFLGTVELSDALSCRQKVTSVASTAADLVAQKTKVTDTDKANIFNALNSIIYPYPTTGAKIRITSIIDGGASGPKVAWSDAQNMTALSPGSSVSVPTGLVQTGGSVIRAEITYSFTSGTAKLVTNGISMTDTFYARPRKIAQIPRTAS